MNFTNKAINLVAESEKSLTDLFSQADAISYNNQLKVLNAFTKNQISLRHFSNTSGYGYDDVGRDTLAKLFADIFNTEAAIVSPLIASGTHALSICLFGLLRPNDLMLSISGTPYDTLLEVIGGEGIGSLKDFAIDYKEIELQNNTFNKEAIAEAINVRVPKLIFIGRSRGYSWRNAISISEIEEIIKLIKSINNNIIIMVDNCYGEFVDLREPTDVGADVMAGSLIKNPGGGIAPTGGYVCGRKDLVELIGGRLTAPSIGLEVGSYNASYMPFYQGLFLAPHTVANAIKGNILCGEVFARLGYEVMPTAKSYPLDIIRSIKFNTEDELVSFCRSVQESSPIDSHVVPYPWEMPGYEDKVIMAAGAFVQGASLELSADSPIRKPYIAYMQGGLTYEHVKIAITNILSKLI